MQSTWTQDRLVPDEDNAIGLSGSPAAAVFRGEIYLFHQGRDNDGRIWYSTFNGSSWSEDRALGQGTYYGIRNSPSVAVFNNKLYVAYCDPDGLLRVGGIDSAGNWFNVLNAPTYGISYSPSAAVFRNRLYIAYQGSGSNAGKLMYTSTDGNSWAPETSVGAIHMLGAPALAVYQDRLHCFHKGTNDTVDTSRILMFDNICDLLGIDDPWVTMSFDIMMAIADDISGAGDVKTVAQAGIAIDEVISKATSRAGDWLWHTAFDGATWREDVLCPSAEDAYGINSEAPAAIEYGNRLFCIRQGRDSSYLWFGIHGGRGWYTDHELGVPGNTFCTTGAPALVVFNGTLYCFHQERNDGGWLWMTTLTAPALGIPAPAPNPQPSANRISISCDNEYELYFNGTRMGSGANWMAMDSYPITLNPGKNVVAVRGRDQGGAAAMLAEIRAGARMYASDTGWRVSANAPAGWEAANFDDSGWETATEYGAYGVGPWSKAVSNCPDDTPARWIWSRDNQADDLVCMRLTFNTGAINAAANVAAGNSAHRVSARVKVTALPEGRAWIMLLGNEGAGSHHWLLNSDGTTQFGVWGGAQLKPSLPLQRWVQIEMAFDGTMLHGYVDGSPIGSVPASFNLQGIPLDVGNAHIGERNFNGFVQDLRVNGVLVK